MKRFEIYINSKGNLTIDLFRKYEDENVYSTYRGNDAYELIRSLATKIPSDIVENRIRDNISLEYKDYIVILNEPNILLNRKGLGPFINTINKYNEADSKEIVKNKKVTRKNKFSGRKILATTLVIVALGAVALNIPKTETLDNLNDFKTNRLVQIDEQKKDDNIINNLGEIYFEEEEKESVFVDYGDRASTEKAYITKAYYGGLIEKYARQYGLDPNLVLGIATQERGIHSENKDYGGATGLMQIQNSVWENEYITAYNYETNKMEKVYVTNNKIKDVSNNIKFGCMYLQNCMEYMDYNVMAAVQCYNMGYGNVMKVLNAYSKVTNKPVKDILKDHNDTGWLEYRKLINVGDQKYIEHVFSWIGSDFNIENKKTDNTTIKLNIVNQIQTKNISLK